MRSPHTATKSSPHSSQLEKARAQQRRPNAAKNKINKLKKKEVTCCVSPICIHSFVQSFLHSPLPSGMCQALWEVLTMIWGRREVHPGLRGSHRTSSWCVSWHSGPVWGSAQGSVFCFVLFCFLALPHGLQDLRSPTRDGTRALSSGSPES